MNREQQHIALLSILTVLSVIFFHAKFLLNWDAGQFALGTIHYSLNDHTPHPPGYYLFVQAGKVLTHATHDVNISFIILACLAAVGALIFFYKTVVLVTGNTSFALLISLFLFLNPIFWFSRSVALTYAFEAFAISLSLWTSAEIILKKNMRVILFSYPALAILAGFRPSIILASLPLFAIQAWHMRRKIALLSKGVLAGALCALLWLIPFTLSVGGFSAALSAIAGQAQGVQANPSLFFVTLLICLNTLLVLPIIAWREMRSTLNSAAMRVALASALFSAFIFTFFHFGETGYILALLPPLLLVLTPAFCSIFSSSKGKILLALIACVQVVIFFVPLEGVHDKKLRGGNFFAIREHDDRIAAFISAVRLSPKDSVIVILRGQYFDPEKNVRSYPSEDIRLLTYYLPEYTLIDFPGTRGLYMTVHSYKKTEHAATFIPFSASARELLILADYIHPIVYPKGATLHNPPTTPAAKNIYRASLENVNAFEFEGFTFSRKLVNRRME